MSDDACITKTIRYITVLVSAVMLLTFITVCANFKGSTEEQIYTEEFTIDIFDEAVPLTAAPTAQPAVTETAAPAAPTATAAPAAKPVTPEAAAPGTLVKKCDKAVIDYSNSADGYVMVKYNDATASRLKVLVKGPKTTYNYNLTPQEWTVFPFNEGDGQYSVSLYINVRDTKYANVLSVTLNVTLKNEFGPYLYTNQYVDYANAPMVVAKAAELTEGLTTNLEKIKAVYDYVVDTLSYDYEKAKIIQTGYLPDLDKVLEAKKGICFDYATLTAGMLRSLNIPCKMIIGYTDGSYHAWIEVWSDAEGQIEDGINFSGNTWERMDPTFASCTNRSASMMEFIADGSHYSATYIY